LLGLADVVGELRRSVLDFLRKGDVKSAEKNLGTMELIYDELIVMDKALHAISRLRRKTDIARRIVESTRGDVTIEARRGVLERSLKKLERVLNTAKK
jgi:translin